MLRDYWRDNGKFWVGWLTGVTWLVIGIALRQQDYSWLVGTVTVLAGLVVADAIT